MTQLSQFGNILLYIIGGIMFLMLVWLLNYILAPSRPNPEKLTTYECGEDPVGNANLQFNMRFYVVGLIFLIFDVEILFLFPWATVFAEAEWVKNIPHWGIFALTEMSIFVLILVVGLAYVWAKGDLEWTVPKPLAPKRVNPVPDSLYQKVNEKYA